MNRRWWLLALLLLSLPVRAERRAALVVGDNEGDARETPLRYAEADAVRMRDALVQVGGVLAQDVVLLRGPSPRVLREAMAALLARFSREAWGREDRLVVYVSSHAGEGELHLGGARFPMGELRRFVEAAPVGVALLLVDACDAGSVMRAKGLVAADGRTIVVPEMSVTGRVVIASASPGEASFESESLGGSLFTHHLVAGLRGAADASRDGRVTLQEAYAYAYARTVESAAAVRAGQQTPTFDVVLAGHGELVVAEPGRARSRLRLELGQPGEWLVTSLDGGLVTRFVKGVGPATLALEPGIYRLRTREGDTWLEGTVSVTDGQEQPVTAGDLLRWRLESPHRKGAGPEESPRTLLGVWGSFGGGVVPNLGLLAGWAVGARRHSQPDPGGAAWLASAGLAHRVGRATVGSLVEREIGLSLGLGRQVPVGPVHARALLGAGALAARQEGLPETRLALVPRASLELGLAWPLAGPWRLDALVEAGGAWVRTNRGAGPSTWVSGGIGVGYAL